MFEPNPDDADLTYPSQSRSVQEMFRRSPPSYHPRVFFAFKHNPAMLTLTGWMRDALAARGVNGYRLVDHPVPGTDLRERAKIAIRNSAGMVLLWSQQATESVWVRAEYDYARFWGKAICLVAFPGVRKPVDWNMDVEWVDLGGVSANQPVTGQPRAPDPTITDQAAFDIMMQKIVIFARFNQHSVRR